MKLKIYVVTQNQNIIHIGYTNSSIYERENGAYVKFSPCDIKSEWRGKARQFLFFDDTGERIFTLTMEPELINLDKMHVIYFPEIPVESFFNFRTKE